MINIKSLKPILLLVLVVLALAVLGVFSLFFTPPTVTSVNPLDQSLNVLDSTPIKLAFENAPTASQLNNLALTLTPNTPLSLTWNNTLLTATPLSPLEPHTFYALTLTYRQKPIFSSSFTTNLFSEEELKVQASQQILDDKIQADVEKAYYQAAPWLRSLPLETSSYRVIYDYETNRLRIRLLNGNTEEILPQILAALKAHQIDTDTIGYDLVY